MQSVVEVDAFGFYSLFFKNVDFDEERFLEAECWKYGEIKDMHRKGGTSRHVFVRFASKEQAERALRFLKDKYDVDAATRNMKYANLPFFKEQRYFPGKRYTNFANISERRLTPAESKRYGKEVDRIFNAFSGNEEEEDSPNENRRFERGRGSAAANKDFDRRHRVRSLSCDGDSFDRNYFSDNSMRKEPRFRDQSETKTVRFSKDLQDGFDSETESGSCEMNCHDDFNIKNKEVDRDFREFPPQWTDHLTDQKMREKSHSTENKEVDRDFREFPPKWTDHLTDQKMREKSHSTEIKEVNRVSREFPPKWTDHLTDQKMGEKSHSTEVFAESPGDKPFSNGRASVERDGISSSPNTGKQEDNMLKKDTPSELGDVQSPGTVITSVDLQDLDASSSDEQPPHLNELLVSNMSSETTSEDVVRLLTAFKPVNASVPQPMLPLCDGSETSYCCIIKFAYTKSVTYIIKYIRTLFLHGRAVSLRRLSTVLETSDYPSDFCLAQ